MTTTMKVVDKATGAESTKDVTVAQDEGIRAGHDLRGRRRRSSRRSKAA